MNWISVLLTLATGSALAATFQTEYHTYRMKFTATFTVETTRAPQGYFKKAHQHASYAIGQMAYQKLEENAYATGAPLRTPESVKIKTVVPVSSKSVEITYEYDSEVVLDTPDVTRYYLFLPKGFEEIQRARSRTVIPCVHPGSNVSSEEGLNYYWMPLNENCTIPFSETVASLSPTDREVTYPDYPRMVRNGKISVAIFIAKMEERFNHDPTFRRGSQGRITDESTIEYYGVAKRLSELGLKKIRSKISKDTDESSIETYETSLSNGTRLVVNLVYGNSVFRRQKKGMNDFRDYFTKLAKDAAYVVYSGHLGFMMNDDDLIPFNPDVYQVFFVNGCQSEVYAHPVFAGKSSKDLDFFFNARETVVNPAAITTVVDAITDWGNQGQWTSYPDLVQRMDRTGAMLGVMGEQDNPKSSYNPVDPTP